MAQKITDFSRLLHDYISTHMTIDKNLSSNTITSYKDAYVLLLEFMKEKYNTDADTITISSFSEDVIREYLVWLEANRDNSISTRNQRLAAIRSLFKYFGSKSPEHLLLSQQINSIPDKAYPLPQIRHLSMEETKLLLSLPDQTTRKGLRDMALLSLLYDSGMRVQELCDICVIDVRLTKPYQINIFGKGRKHRTVPITESVAAILERYIHVYSLDAYEKRTSPLFFNHNGEKLTRQGVTYILKKYAGQIEGIENITPHILRHTKAMHLTDAEINIIYIRDFLGHSDFKTTQRYAKTSVVLKRKALEKLNTLEPIIPSDNIGSSSSEFGNAESDTSESRTADWLDDIDLLTWLNNLGR